MLAKLLPLLFLIAGTGGGVGAGLFLVPGPQSHFEMGGHGPTSEQAGSEKTPATMTDSHGNPIDPSATEFVKMSNQFVIPVVKNDKISALVVVSLSLETRVGISENIYEREPKLRDMFLRVLFDHANMGGFQGAFTKAETMNLLRSALREVAQKEFGSGVQDVLIVDIVRQDS